MRTPPWCAGARSSAARLRWGTLYLSGSGDTDGVHGRSLRDPGGAKVAHGAPLRERSYQHLLDAPTATTTATATAAVATAVPASCAVGARQQLRPRRERDEHHCRP